MPPSEFALSETAQWARYPASNRRNAKRSTGLRTATGKAISSLYARACRAARSGRWVNKAVAFVDKVATGSYHIRMRSVGLKVLKNKLSEYVRLAAGGETVLVTDRDRVVAELVPPQAGRSPLLADALLADAVRKGWLIPAIIGGSGAPPRKPIMTFRELLEDLQHDREER